MFCFITMTNNNLGFPESKEVVTNFLQKRHASKECKCPNEMNYCIFLFVHDGPTRYCNKCISHTKKKLSVRNWFINSKVPIWTNDTLIIDKTVSELPSCGPLLKQPDVLQPVYVHLWDCRGWRVSIHFSATGSLSLQPAVLISEHEPGDLLVNSGPIRNKLES